ncbi:MAG: hypothetical protein EBS06_09000 [Proteobacteria bacterium]|nr:hypothetical protein [Pseudomonadota bacterium]
MANLVFMSKKKQIERLLKLLSYEDNKINDCIVSFKEYKYKSKFNEKCKYCCKKPNKMWIYKSQKIKICTKCCEEYRNTFHVLL